jgi:hypothetical protein
VKGGFFFPPLGDKSSPPVSTRDLSFLISFRIVDARVKLLLFYAGLTALIAFFTRDYQNPSPNSKQAVATNYTHLVCENAFNHTLDFSNYKDNNFKVALQEGCFGDWVKIPSWWKEWHCNQASDPATYWVAFWYANDSPHGIYKANATFNLNKGVHDLFRLQGHGTILFYTNQPSRTSEPTEAKNPDAKSVPFQPALPKLTQLDIRGDNPHYCDRSRDAIKDTMGVTGIYEPKFSFSDTHEGNTITWANGFTGTVPVCFVVDELGTPADIYFIQSPPEYIEKHILSIMRGWHFKPGMQVRQNRAVRVQLMNNFIFR